MPRLHILAQISPNLYDVVVHAPTPVGNNSAGVAWSAAVAADGTHLDRNGVAQAPASSMMVGTGPGQIDPTEAAQIANGTLIEARFRWGDDPAFTNAQRLADLNARATEAVNDALARYGERLKQYGRVVT